MRWATVSFGYAGIVAISPSYTCINTGIYYAKSRSPPTSSDADPTLKVATRALARTFRNCIGFVIGTKTEARIRKICFRQISVSPSSQRGFRNSRKPKARMQTPGNEQQTCRARARGKARRKETVKTTDQSAERHCVRRRWKARHIGEAPSFAEYLQAASSQQCQLTRCSMSSDRVLRL